MNKPSIEYSLDVRSLASYSQQLLISSLQNSNVTEGDKERNIVLTKPLSSDEESDVDYKAPNLIQRILSLFKNMRLGSDLTRMQLPPQFNIPKSQLQCYGESVYCVGNDMLGRCNSKNNPLERFLAVISWNISTLRSFSFGFAPYNPILGETHHVSRGNLNLLLEQVSHYPPVTALHATDDKQNIELLWCQSPAPKFHGTCVETEVRGKRQLRLMNHGETYTMNTPKLVIKLLPIPGVDWVGKDRIQCYETGLEAELWYGGRSFFGLRGNDRSIKGKIFESSSSLRLLYEINGHWDRTVTAKHISSGKVVVLYNAKDVISGLKAPTVRDPKALWTSESAVVWSEVSQGIMSKDWAKAKEAKTAVEEKQRERLIERESRRDNWVPKHFNVSYSKEVGWVCSPIQNNVSSAPIFVPL